MLVGVVAEHGDTFDQMCAAVGKLAQIDRAVCRAEAERRFSVRAVADEYEALYRRLLGIEALDAA